MLQIDGSILLFCCEVMVCMVSLMPTIVGMSKREKLVPFINKFRI